LLQDNAVEFSEIIEAGNFLKLDDLKNAFHRNLDTSIVDGSENNDKWLSADSKSEYIVRKENGLFSIETNSKYYGTYNYGGPTLSELFDHFNLDVDPWNVFGNLPDDPSSVSERADLRISGLVDFGLSVVLPDSPAKVGKSFVGTSGNDVIGQTPTEEDNELFYDVYNGLSGTDTASFFGSGDGVVASLEVGKIFDGAGTVENIFGKLLSIENINGSSYADIFIGDEFSNILRGLGGNDYLSGLSGDDELFGGIDDDTLKGGHGNDLLNGSTGFDTAVYDGNLDQYSIVALANGTHLVSSVFGTDILTDIEQVQFADTEFALIPYVPPTETSGVLNISLGNNLTNGNAQWSSSSGDGRFVVYEKNSGSSANIFLHDIDADTTKQVSVSSSGITGNSVSYAPSISDDGRFVAFESRANNLISGDSNGSSDIYLHDTSNDETTRVSVSSGDSQGNNASYSPSLSGDGRFIVFQSYASNLVAGDSNARADIFVHDTLNDETTRVSVATGGLQSNGDSHAPFISSDGRFIAYESDATNLVANDTNGKRDVFLYDISSRETTRVSIATGEAEGDGRSFSANLSSDGKLVAYRSEATNLVTGDTNGARDIFIHNTETGETTRLSQTETGGETNADAEPATLSADGRYLAYTSFATNIVSGDTNGRRDVFVHDTIADEVKRVSLSDSRAQANADARAAWISSDGHYIFFQSAATNLVSRDNNGALDVFRVPNPLNPPVKIILETDHQNDVLVSSDLEEVYLSTGLGIVSGEAENLDGDQIHGFDESKSLLVLDTTFTLSNLQVTMGSAILDIDTDQDGTFDTQITLNGDYTGATFDVRNFGPHSEITVEFPTTTIQRFDTADTYVWESYTDILDASGARISRTMIYDNGREASNTYENGNISSRSVDDKLDAYSWTSIELIYDNSDLRVQQTNTYDSGRVLVIDYMNGIRAFSTMTDVADTDAWTSYTNTYDAAGIRTSRSMTYDDGREALNSYSNGMLVSRSVEDKSDAFIWDMIDVSYDGAGQRLQQTNSYDNGRVLVTDFAAGVRSGSVMTDGDDVYAWESLTDTYDINGDRTERTTLYDDGRVVITSYVDDLG